MSANAGAAMVEREQEAIEPMDDQEALDRSAVERVLAGDLDAYDQLVAIHARRVMAIAWGIVRNESEAEDLAQEAFVRAFERFEQFDSRRRFGPWIGSIVTHLALDLVRHRQRFRHDSLDAVPSLSAAGGADERAVSGEIAARIDAAIEALPLMQKTVARLYLVEQIDHAEIAEITGLSPGTVRSHLSLARTKLRDQLGEFR